jgi:PAS domain S-box-containing protein
MKTPDYKKYRKEELIRENDELRRRLSIYADNELKPAVRDLMNIGGDVISLYENIKDGVYIVDTAGYFVYVNSVIEKRSGIPREKFRKLHILDIIRPEYHETVKTKFRMAMDGHDNTPYELAYTTGTGEIKSVEVNSIPVKKDGRIIGLLGISRDISLRKSMEKKLSETELMYHRLLEASPDPVVILQYELIMYASRSFTGVFGYSQTDIDGGLSIYRLIPEKYREPAKRRYGKKIIDENAPNIFTLEILTKDGRSIPCETSSAVIHYGGRNAALVIVRDISERIIVEQLRRESEEMYRILAEQTLLGIMIVQENGITYANRVICEINEYSVEELMRFSLDDIFAMVHPEDRAYVAEQTRMRVFSENDPPVGNYSYRIFTKSGKIKWVEIFSKRISLNGRPASFVTVVDITERKMAESALRKNHDMLSMSQRMAHVGSWRLDLASGNIEWSEEMFRIAGLDPAAGNPTADQNRAVIHPEDLELFDNTFKMISKTTSPFEIEFRIVRTDGAVRHLLNNCEIDQRQVKEKLVLIGTTQDITGRKIAERALLESEERYRILDSAGGRN